MFKHLLRRRSTKLADLRRRTLTLVSVISEQHGPLGLGGHLLAAVVAEEYIRSLLPVLVTYGRRRWEAAVRDGSLEARPGGFFSEVSWTWALLCSVAYTFFVLLGVRRMERRPPIGRFVFECLAAYNCMHCLINCYCFAKLCMIGVSLGGPLQEPQDHAIGRQVWLQYHCRQLELLGTAFMVLRKKFDQISYLHLYLRVLNLWGWYFGCRYACGESYIPALITAACQAILYFYYSLSSLGIREVPIFKKARLTEVQLLQYGLCTVHNLWAAARGQLLWSLALLHLFVIANGLMLYGDFHMQDSQEPAAGEVTPPSSPMKCSARSSRFSWREDARVAFSFDSCGWLMVYHFGVAHWLQQQLMPEVTPESAGSDKYPAGVRFSGSSGGALIGCVLAAGMSAKVVFEFILEQRPACERDFTQMFPAVRRALMKFQYNGAYNNLCGRLRVLVTRVSSQPPFVMGEVVDQFASNDNALDTLCASCHVPGLAGLWPYPIKGSSGTRYYYDGLAWPSSLMVPWRGAHGDKIIRVSAMCAPLSDIRNHGCPLWWGLFPPDEEVLRGMFWCGYRDAALWFSTKPTEAGELCQCGTRRQPPARDKKDDRRDQPSTPIRTSSGSDNELHGDLVFSEGARWRAAQELLSKPLPPVTQQMPAVDPASGEDVLVLISRFQVAAERANRFANGIAAAAAVALAAVAVNYQPIMMLP